MPHKRNARGLGSRIMRGRCQQEVEGVQRPQGAGQRYFGTAFGAAPRAPMVFEGTRRLLWEANVGSVAGFYRTAGCRPRLRDLKKKRVCQGGADQYGGWGSLQGRGVRRGVVWRCGVSVPFFFCALAQWHSAVAVTHTHTHTHALLKDFTPTSGRSLPRAPLPQAEKTKKEKRNKKKGNGDRRKGKKEGRRKWSLRVGVRRRAGRQ